MTLIECFINSPVENIAAALCLSPQKILFIGSADNIVSETEKYRQLLNKKGIRTEIVCRKTAEDSFKSAEKAIRQAVLDENDCVLDITGGQEATLLAAGAVYESLKTVRPFKIVRFNAETSLMTDVISGQENIGQKAALSVNELIRLYGGLVAPEKPLPAPEQIADDVNNLWQTVCESPAFWNKAQGVLTAFEKKARLDKSKLAYCFDLNRLKGEIKGFEEKFSLFSQLIKKLAKQGLLKGYSQNENTVRYTYKNRFVKRCFTKAGDVLEMKTYFEAQSFAENGKSYFNDCRLSVNIDWDGVLHSSYDTKKDTANEIDVILMRGCVPIFISCKNGQIGEIELYKLSTVASRFGGKYAKKVLTATDFERESQDSAQAFRQRARDMNITLIENAAQLSKEAWEQTFKDI